MIIVWQIQNGECRTEASPPHVSLFSAPKFLRYGESRLNIMCKYTQRCQFLWESRPSINTIERSQSLEESERGGGA